MWVGVRPGLAFAEGASRRRRLSNTTLETKTQVLGQNSRMFIQLGSSEED